MAFDQKLWDANACGPRSLIELARRQTPSRVITPLEIYDRFKKYNKVVWEARPGAVDTFLLVKIIQDLKIARFGVSHVDHEQLIAGVPNAIGTLGFTDLGPDETGKLTQSRHIMLVWPQANGFNFWNPLKKETQGKMYEEGFLNWGHWYAMKMRGMLLCGDMRPIPLSKRVRRWFDRSVKNQGA